MSRLVMITGSCCECGGPSDIFSLPYNMNLVSEMSLYQKWYHDEYLNPGVENTVYRSFSDWIVSRGAIKNPPEVKCIDEDWLEHKCEKLWTYERPKSEFDKMMERMFTESFINFSVPKVKEWPETASGNTITWQRFGL